MHQGTLDSYETVVRVKRGGKTPVYGVRYLVRCLCGWSTDCPDYIEARRVWRTHSASP